MKVAKNKNKELAEYIQKKVNDNDGYCPCRLERTPENKCMCAEFRKQIQDGIVGECHCGLYVIEETADEVSSS